MPKPVTISNNTGSTREMSDEVAGNKTLDRYRWPQDQRQPRRCVLEGIEGHRRHSRHDFVRACRRYRFRAAPWQPVIRYPLVCPRSLSNADGRREKRARCRSRDDGLAPFGTNATARVNSLATNETPDVAAAVALASAALSAAAPSVGDECQSAAP